MTAENNVSRPKTGLERVVGRLNAPDVTARLEALAHMDPLSLGY